jgi:uncharacterized 2Fe-2S/4Fe-4S cluster protein (DUF4445 family)
MPLLCYVCQLKLFLLGVDTILRATCMLQAQRASLQKKLEERQADLEARKAALAAVRAGALVCAMRPLMFKAPQFISLDVDHCNWL